MPVNQHMNFIYTVTQISWHFWGTLCSTSYIFSVREQRHLAFPQMLFIFKHQLLFCRAEDCDDENMDNTTTLWVALAVVQSYNPRRKVPRSDISIPDLECCLSKASFSAAQNSGKFLHTLAYSDIKNWTV